MESKVLFANKILYFSSTMNAKEELMRRYRREGNKRRRFVRKNSVVESFW
jgi:hypothetical protein